MIALLAVLALWATPIGAKTRKRSAQDDERARPGSETNARSDDGRATALKGSPDIEASRRAVEVADIGPERGSVLGLDGFLIDPGNPNEILASTDVTGIFKSTDGGKNWRPANLGLIDSLGHLARLPNIRRDPSHPRTVYAASLSGLYRSTDFGEHWSQLSSTFGLKDVAVSPTAPSVLFAVSFDGFAGSFYKSTDGGTTLVPQPGTGLPDPDIADGIFAIYTNVVITPSDPQTMYVADENSGFYKSTDGGASFTFLPGRYGTALQVFPHPTQRDTVFFEAAGRSTTGLLRSTDGGATFSDVTGGLPTGGVQFVTFDPGNPLTVYAASTEGLLRSTDGGLTFTSLGLKPNQLDAARGGALVVNLDPTNPRVLYVNSGDRNFKSVDRGRSFTEIDSGFRATQVTNVVFDSHEDPGLYIIADGILFRTRDRGKHYDEITLPDGLFPRAVAVAPTDRNRIVIATSPSGILWSSDRGRSWNASVIITDESFFTGGIIAFDPQNARNVYIASDHLLRSTDGGQTFTAMPLANIARAMAIDPQQSNVIYLSGVNGSINGPALVLRSSDAGLTFEDALMGLGFVNGIIINPQDPRTVYVAGFVQRDFGEPYGAETNIVLRSTDGGVTFTPADAGLSGTFSAIAIDPAEPDRLFALCSTGLFRTEDGGTNWSPLDPGGATRLHPGGLKINPKRPKLIYLGGASLLEVEIRN